MSGYVVRNGLCWVEGRAISGDDGLPEKFGLEMALLQVLLSALYRVHFFLSLHMPVQSRLFRKILDTHGTAM